MKSAPSILNHKRVWNALRYSCQGLKRAWQDEAAFRQELVCFAVLLPVTVWLHLDAVETLFLTAHMVAVLALELLNSGLEALVDKVSPEHHPLAGKAKDCGSAAVLLSLLSLLVSWVVLAGPPLWARLAG